MFNFQFKFIFYLLKLIKEWMNSEYEMIANNFYKHIIYEINIMYVKKKKRNMNCNLLYLMLKKREIKSGFQYIKYIYLTQ